MTLNRNYTEAFNNTYKYNDSKILLFLNNLNIWYYLFNKNANNRLFVIIKKDWVCSLICFRFFELNSLISLLVTYDKAIHCRKS